MSDNGRKTILEAALRQGLTEEEFERIVQLLGRDPSPTEAGMYSVMWSEHCSYKNSIAEIKKLPRSGPRLLVNAGEENAGLVDIGDGLAIAFKIESHNHPSAVEPYQGAATGVGGIMRDIFTMGARPIAALNSLRFGNPGLARTQYLMKGIVKGIGDYGNSFGVPTVAGEVYFDDCYNDNPLVNAMAVGIVEAGKVAKATGEGVGNLVIIVGSSTGRDGIHGATFASDSITEESEQKRPSVQVGDPFTEKLLLEATLEAIDKGLIVGVQDMGAAGITCSTSEMSAKAGLGMEIELSKVPLRESGMTAYEIMLSESQERMLLVVKPEKLEDIRLVYEKWDLHCEVIGRVTGDGILRVQHHGHSVAVIPSQSLVLGGGAPVYQREARTPEYFRRVREPDLSAVDEPDDYSASFLRLLGSPNICSRRWVYEQYDSMVRTNTVTYGTSDAAVIRIKNSPKAIAVKTDCNPRYVYLNPYIGGMIAVAESARNVVCVGATPIAITNCLNFGDPYDPEVFFQFKEAVRGIGDACRFFGTPVTGGNVSFYNQSPAGAIYPTPVIGMLGEIKDVHRIMSASFKHEGDLIVLLGDTTGHLGGSEYLQVIHGKVAGDAPPLDLTAEKNLQDACLELIRTGMISSCHDLSEGGLAIALAECCVFGKRDEKVLGARVRLTDRLRHDLMLFGEDQSRVLISASSENIGAVERVLQASGVSHAIIGEVVKGMFSIEPFINLDLKVLSKTYYGSFPVTKEVAPANS